MLRFRDPCSRRTSQSGLHFPSSQSDLKPDSNISRRTYSHQKQVPLVLAFLASRCNTTYLVCNRKICRNKDVPPARVIPVLYPSVAFNISIAFGLTSYFEGLNSSNEYFSLSATKIFERIVFLTSCYSLTYIFYLHCYPTVSMCHMHLNGTQKVVNTFATDVAMNKHHVLSLKNHCT